MTRPLQALNPLLAFLMPGSDLKLFFDLYQLGLRGGLLTAALQTGDPARIGRNAGYYMVDALALYDRMYANQEAL